MVSHCLKHQDNQATARCSSCSIPLCDLCIERYENGVYCSRKCFDSAKEGAVRMEAMRQQEADAKARRQKAALIKMVVYIFIAGGIYIGWDSLPEGLTSVIEEYWTKLTE